MQSAHLKRENLPQNSAFTNIAITTFYVHDNSFNPIFSKLWRRHCIWPRCCGRAFRKQALLLRPIIAWFVNWCLIMTAIIRTKRK